MLLGPSTCVVVNTSMGAHSKQGWTHGCHTGLNTAVAICSPLITYCVCVEQDLSLNLYITIPTRPTGQKAPGILLLLPLELGFLACATTHGVSMCPGNLNLGVHVCVAITSATEPSPQLKVFNNL